MEGNRVKITDLVQFSLLNQDLVKVKDDFTQGLFAPPQVGTPGKGLAVRIAATHAGIVTRNNTFYLPEKMRAGIPTFTENYLKPVLVNHNEMGDPIGRITSARYVDTSHIVKDLLKTKNNIKDHVGSRLVLNDQLIEDFCSGKLPYGAQVDVVRGLLRDNLLEDPNYAGLGYAEIIANITDPAAVEKFLDGRYMTGSVSASTNKAVCSNCKQDWTQDGPCDHKPGKVYDSKKMFLIMGDFFYEEYSVANKPADRHSRVLELYFNGVKDSITLDDADSSGRIYEVTLQFPDYSSKEENVMTKKVQDSTEEPVNKETPVVPPVVTDESFDDFMTRVLDFEKTPELSDSDGDKLYQLLVDEMKASGLTEDQLKDAVLSSEKRKGLAKSTFCGPNRSFPVPDCNHVTAARRLVGRYGGPGSKESILACVDRKAKAMGCGSSDSVVVPPEAAKEPDVLQAADKLSEEDFKKLFDGVLGLAKKRNPAMLRELYKTEEPALVNEVTTLETKLGDMRDEVARHTKLHTDLTNQLTALKEEYKLVADETTVLQDALVKTKADLRGAKVKHLSVMKSLKKGDVLDEAEQAALLQINDQAVDSELESVSKDVDIKKITDKLSDGTSRKPAGTVENPTGLQDTSKTTFTVEQVRDELAKVDQKYWELKFTNSLVAEQYRAREIARMQREGKLSATV